MIGILLLQGEIETPYQEYGIAQFQGYDELIDDPAGNIFGLNGTTITSDYDNDFEHIIYFHHDETTSPAGIVPKYYSEQTITLQNTTWQYNEPTSCPSEIDLKDRLVLRSGISSNQLEINSTTTDLENYIDGGNTSQLENEIFVSQPDEAYELYNDLMSESPYLSDIVLLSAIEKENVLSNAMITEILSINTHSAKSQKIMDEVDQKINPLSDDMIEDIEEGKNILSAKENLEAKKAHYVNNNAYAKNELKRVFNQDTLYFQRIDSTIAFLNNDEDLKSKYELASAHITKKDFQNANTVLNNISTIYDLTEAQGEFYATFSDYCDLMEELNLSGKTIFNLDSAQKQVLIELCLDTTSLAGRWVNNILLWTDSLTLNEKIYFPAYELMSSKEPARDNMPLPEANIMIYPIPASDYFVIEFMNVEKILSHDILVRIFSVNGKMVDQFFLKKSQSRHILPTGNLSNGTYLCIFVADNKVIEQKKLTILK